MPGNAYDVYTLPTALKQAVVVWGIDPAIVFIHRGQKDVEIDQMQICCSGQRRVEA